jgi:hypothetical protein
MKKTLLVIVSFLMVACSTPETKRAAFPKMYDQGTKPVSMVVVPAINNSTAADATHLIVSTLTIPFADHGYYVMPMSIVDDIFKNEGITDGAQLVGMDASIFKDNFGADSVLYVTIEEWDTNYMVLAANVTVGMKYVLVSTSTNEVLWSYQARQVVDTAGDSSGNLIVDLIKTAVTTAVTDYVPIAYRVNNMAVTSLPYGVYHPQYEKDADMAVVSKAAREEALKQE